MRESCPSPVGCCASWPDPASWSPSTWRRSISLQALREREHGRTRLGTLAAPLFLASLLPIVRNTATGLEQVPLIDSRNWIDLRERPGHLLFLGGGTILLARGDVALELGLPVLAVVAQMIAGALFGLYRGRYSFGSFDEAKALILVTLVVTIVVQAFLLILGVWLHMPRSIGLIAFPFAWLFMAAVRYLKRMYVESKSKPSEHAPHAVVYGAGFLGNTLVTQMLQDKDSPYLPVAIIDDDPAKKQQLWSKMVEAWFPGGVDDPDLALVRDYAFASAVRLPVYPSLRAIASPMPWLAPVMRA